MRRRGFLKRLGVAASAAAASRLHAAPTARAAGRAGAAALARLKHWPASLHARVARHEAGRLVRETRGALDAGAVARLELDGAFWTCALRAEPVKAADAVDLL